MFGTYFALYLQSLGFAAAQIAVLMSLQQFVRIATPFFWGWLADRLHRRTAIIRVTLLMATGVFTLLFWVGGYGSLFAVFVAMFAFWSAALPLFEANVIATVEGDSGRYARIRMWGSTGFIVAVLLAGSALDHLPMRSLLWMVLGMLVLAALSSMAIPEHRPAAGATAARQSIWPILRRPEVMALFAACFLMMASQASIFVFYSIYMVESGHSKSTVGILWSMGVVAEIAIFLTLPKLNARFAPQSLFSFSFAVTAVRYLLIGWFPGSLALQLLAQSLHAFTFGTWHAAAMGMLHQFFPAQFGTRGQALYTGFSFGIGGALGGVVAGMAWDAIGPAWMFTAMSVVVFVGWAIAFRYVKRPSPSAPHATAG